MENLKNISFLKGHVFHSRQDVAKNAFSYPIFNIYFNVADQNKLQALFENKFFNVLGLNSSSYLNGKELHLKAEIANFVQNRFSFSDYDSVFLQTIPKIFGYAFNPVSFWYFFKNNNLVAVLSEVNNTFGERHYYWLQDSLNNLNGQWIKSDKEFHVSPFYEVNGYYKFKFIFKDDLIESHIQYLDNNHQNKLITWIKGRLTPVEETSLASILLNYGWMTPLVVFRIHWQAAKLFIKKVKYIKKPNKPDKDVTYGSK